MDPHKLYATLQKVVGEEFQVMVEKYGPMISNEFKKTLIDKIKKQSFSWPPLNPKYRRRKIKKGLDRRMLIARSDMINSVEARRAARRIWVVDVPQRRHYSGLTYRALWAVHEFGSARRGIPPRPSWRPTIDEYKKEKSDKLNKQFSGELISNIKEKLTRARTS